MTDAGGPDDQSHDHSDDRAWTGRRRLLVAAIVASHFGPPFMFSGVAVALPQLGEELGAGAVALGLVETLFLAGGLAFLLPAGRIADATDKGTLFQFGMLLFGAISAAIAVTTSLPLLLALRLLQGVHRRCSARPAPPCWPTRRRCTGAAACSARRWRWSTPACRSGRWPPGGW